jgi:prepilin-type processing-associated H-X9-DG protein
VWQDVSYAINDSLLGDGNRDSSGNNPHPTASAALAAPASTVMLCEAFKATMDISNMAAPDYSVGATMDQQFWGGCTTACRGSYATGNPPGQSLNLAPGTGNGVHTDGSNYLAADGHVKWLRAAAISPGKDALNATDPENDPGEHAAGTSYMNVHGGAQGSATLTFSKI